VTTVLVQGREPSVISDYCREKCGCVLGRGIRELGGRACSAQSSWGSRR